MFTLVSINKDNFDSRRYSITELVDKVTSYVPPKFKLGKVQKIIDEDSLSDLLLNQMNLNKSDVDVIMDHVSDISDAKATTTANDLSKIIVREKLTEQSLNELRLPLPEQLAVKTLHNEKLISSEFDFCLGNNYKQKYSNAKKNKGQQLDILIMVVKDAEQQFK